MEKLKRGEQLFRRSKTKAQDESTDQSATSQVNGQHNESSGAPQGFVSKGQELHQKNVAPDKSIQRKIGPATPRCRHCPPKKQLGSWHKLASHARKSKQPAVQEEYHFVCITCGRCQNCTSVNMSRDDRRCHLCQPYCHLQALPTEIKENIFVCIDDYASALSFRHTSKHFLHMVPEFSSAAPPTKDGLYRFLLNFAPRPDPRRPLELCRQCVKYHSSDRSLFYAWSSSLKSEVRTYCLR